MNARKKTPLEGVEYTRDTASPSPSGSGPEFGAATPRQSSLLVMRFITSRPSRRVKLHTVPDHRARSEGLAEDLHNLCDALIAALETENLVELGAIEAYARCPQGIATAFATCVQFRALKMPAVLHGAPKAWPSMTISFSTLVWHMLHSSPTKSCICGWVLHAVHMLRWPHGKEAKAGTLSWQKKHCQGKAGSKSVTS